MALSKEVQQETVMMALKVAKEIIARRESSPEPTSEEKNIAIQKGILFFYKNMDC